MEALSSNNQVAEAEDSLARRSLRSLADAELDRRIRVGWEIWCDLLDDLLSTGGLPPSRELAGRVLNFFEDAYWRAEDARVEALRRQVERSLQPSRTVGRSRGISR